MQATQGPPSTCTACNLFLELPGVGEKKDFGKPCRRVAEQEPLPKREAVPTEEWLHVRAASSSLARACSQQQPRTRALPMARPDSHASICLARRRQAPARARLLLLCLAAALSLSSAQTDWSTAHCGKK